MKTGSYKAKSGTPLRRIAELALIDEGAVLPRYNIDDLDADISVPRSGRILVDLRNDLVLINTRNRYYEELKKLLKIEGGK